LKKKISKSSKSTIAQQIETFNDDVGQGLANYVGVLMDTSPSDCGQAQVRAGISDDFIQSVVRAAPGIASSLHLPIMR